jgi:hypothetical protein
MTAKEAAARARPRTLLELLHGAVDAVPSHYRDLCASCGSWWDRPWSSDLDTCPRCVGDDHRTAAEVESDLTEANEKLEALEGIQEERDALEKNHDHQKERADDLVKLCEDAVRPLEAARAALALPEDAAHDDPRRRVLEGLDDVIASLRGAE